jgi:hypothetical protein
MLKFNPTFCSKFFFQNFSKFFERDIQFAISSKCVENACLGFWNVSKDTQGHARTRKDTQGRIRKEGYARKDTQGRRRKEGDARKETQGYAKIRKEGYAAIREDTQGYARG